MPAPPEANQFALGAVVLGAGRSRRMGKPKLLLPWKTNSILGFLLKQWRELGARQVAVVAAPEDRGLEVEFERLRLPSTHLIVNPAPQDGMFSSIRCAVRWGGWRPGLTHWAIVLGDQPHLRRQTLQELLALARASLDKVCQPAFQGRRRHPVVLPRMAFAQIADSEAPNLEAFLKSLLGQTISCDMDDPGLDLDIDYPTDYDKALELARLED